MKKILLTFTLLSLINSYSFSQNNNTEVNSDTKKKWWENIKQSTTFGGYVIGKASFNDQDLDSKNKTLCKWKTLGLQIRTPNGNERCGRNRYRERTKSY